jgi:hypothetical protein
LPFNYFNRKTWNKGVIMSGEIKRKITEEGDKDLIAEWYKVAKDQTPETIGKFINHLINDYVHDYGTIAHAVAASAIAGAWAGNNGGGHITGFQAGAVTLEFMQKWGSFEAPFKIVSYRHLLYPQYDDQFIGMQINKATLESLQKIAQEQLDSLKDGKTKETGYKVEASPRVIERLQNLVAGRFPDFLIITED